MAAWRWQCRSCTAVPRYFAQIIGELLYWIGQDRITFASDYAIWQPKWLVEMFVDFQIPEDMQGEYGVLTTDIKKKILGLNAAKLYDFEVPAQCQVSADAPEGEAIGSDPVSPAAAAETAPVPVPV